MILQDTFQNTKKDHLQWMIRELMINQIESGRSAPSYNTAKKVFEVLATKESECLEEEFVNS